MKTLVLGGARSGKSQYAESLAIQSGKPVTYLATAKVYDPEFALRVKHHQQRRPVEWQLIEEPFFLAQTLLTYDRPDTFLLVDCLTLYLAQWLCPECDPPKSSDWLDEKAQLLKVLPSLQADVALVSNEVGLGIVPMGELNRRYQDEAGWLNQSVAKLCDRAVFMAAGLPLVLK